MNSTNNIRIPANISLQSTVHWFQNSPKYSKVFAINKEVYQIAIQRMKSEMGSLNPEALSSLKTYCSPEDYGMTAFRYFILFFRELYLLIENYAPESNLA